MEFVPASDSSLLVRLASEFSLEAQRRTIQMFRSIQAASIEGVLSLSPGYGSILIRFDPRKSDHAAISQAVLEAAEQPDRHADLARTHHLPVLYDGPDIQDIADRCHLGIPDVVELHCAHAYLVYFLGFLPGFAYMGELPTELIMPRRPAPRHKVPPGSVGIANRNTGIYPVEAPGGWHLLGRCPLTLFDPGRPSPSLLNPGDTVHFYPIRP
jgi:KipI family sensor histidine kinase inhibitor